MGKTAVITGTSTGIGRACVERLAKEGWTVYAGVRKDADAEALRQEVAGDVRPVLLDVTDGERITAFAKELTDELGSRGLDALVNNAGVAEGGPIETLSDADWRWHFDVNVFGLVNMTRELLPLLRAAKGRVVNVGSIAGRVAGPMLGPYSAGKHAVEAISETLRFEVADFGMHVSCVEPGTIATAIWEKGDEQFAKIIGTIDAENLARYDRHIDMLRGFLAEGSTTGVPPAKVADVVHHALTSSRPKHRYLVGPNSKMTALASHLPDRVRQRGLGVMVAKWAKSGRKLRAGA
jgi:NAD(P)-dependent dehydrogenase (short-subunit alcohol dehydrogenase family)